MDSIKHEIIKLFDRYLNNDYLLINFGSFASNQHFKSSDIDLAVYRAKKIPTKIILEIKEELDEKIPTLRDIDLVNLTDDILNNDLINNILDGGKIWKGPKNSSELLKNLKKHFLSLKK